MAKPFFSGNYGSALAKVDTRPIMEAGRAQGQMYANLGKQVGGMIKEYGLNKQKRAKITGEIEAYYKENPNALGEIGMSGDEAQDKKDFTEREKFVKGDMSMAQLEGYAGKLARGDVLKTKNAQNEARAIANEMGRVNLDITNQLKDTRINIEKDKGAISKLARELAVEINPQKKELLTEQMTEAIANLGLGEQKRELQKATMASQTEVLPGATDATIASNETSVMQNEATQQLLPGQTSIAIKKQGLDSANIGIAQETIQQGGGVGGMADRNIRKDDLAMEATQVGIDKNKSYIAYLNANAKKALTKSPQNTSIENSITGLKKEIDTIMKSPSFVKDEDGNALDIEDLFTISASGEVEISEDANVLSKRDIDRLVELVKKQTNLRLSQTTNIVDGNGNLKEVTVAQKEQMIRAKEAQLQAAEQARQQKENEESLKQAEQARLLF